MLEKKWIFFKKMFGHKILKFVVVASKEENNIEEVANFSQNISILYPFFFNIFHDLFLSLFFQLLLEIFLDNVLILSQMIFEARDDKLQILERDTNWSDIFVSVAVHIFDIVEMTIIALDHFCGDSVINHILHVVANRMEEIV